MNELATLAEQVGADIENVRIGIGSDPRIGYSFIYPGAGYGGSCFPKDVRALARTARSAGCPARILEAVEEVNRAQKSVLVHKIRRHFAGRLDGLKIALWGLAFKPNTDDMREAPSLTLIRELLAAGATVQAFDPVAMDEAQRVLGYQPGLTLAADAYVALQGADALAVVTEWREFRSPDFDQVKAALKTPAIFDGRNLYAPELMRRLGFIYHAIGRGAA
jgi:UDPglucose 6-dehydrogenase